MTDATSSSSDRPHLDLSQFGSLDDALLVIGVGDRYERVAIPFLNALAADDRVTLLTMFFMSAVTRARAVHEGIVREIRASNPHTAFALLRQLAQSVAVVHYVADTPEYAKALQGRAPESAPGRVSTEDLLEHMKRYAQSFGDVYAELGEIAEYGTIAVWTAFALDPPDSAGFAWRTRVAWRDDKQAQIACAQTLELAAAMEAALDRLGIACLAQPPTDEPVANVTFEVETPTDA